MTRICVITIGIVLIVFGLALQFRPGLADILLGPLQQPGAGPILLGFALVLSTLFEGRYRNLRGGTGPEDAGWQKTSETFRDEESGRWVQVWFHPASGERRYKPIDVPIG